MKTFKRKICNKNPNIAAKGWIPLCLEEDFNKLQARLSPKNSGKQKGERMEL